MAHSTPSRPPALAQDLVEILVELSVGVHKFAMYPAGHPTLTDIAAELTGHLTNALSARSPLSIGVAYRQLIVGGVPTDARHPLLSDLARRLHDHQLGGISLHRGISGNELEEVLTALGAEPGKDRPPLGGLPPDSAPTWEHAELHRVGYDRLTIREGEEPGQRMDRGTQLWLGLAQVSLATDEPLDEIPDADTVARNIRAHERASAFDQAVVGYLVQLAEELNKGDGSGSGPLRTRVSKLIGELDDATLTRLLEFGGDSDRRQRFLRDANRSLAASSVVKVLRAAAATSGQNISHSMTRLLTKLASHAGDGRGSMGAEAETAFRAHIETLMADWSLDDPNPDAYTLSLDAMARAAPLLATHEASEGALAGAERLVSMAIEVDAWGPIVERAVGELIKPGGTAHLVTLLRRAPPDNDVAERAWRKVANLDTLGRLLRAPDMDNATVAELAARLGEPAVNALLDVLCEAGDLPLRRRAFDVLVGLGDAWVTQLALRRLEDARWFVQRNMLALLRRLEPRLGYLDLMPWANHEHPRVRREALALMLRQRDWVETAIPLALEEDDEHVVRLALERIGPDTPDSALEPVVDRVLLEASRSEELRRVAARTVGWFASTDAADALIRVATAGTTLLGRPRLAPTSPLVLEALWVLATVWREDGVAARVLEAARRSDDPAVAEILREAEAQEAPYPTGESR